jgi:hypothetical protein
MKAGERCFTAQWRMRVLFRLVNQAASETAESRRDPAAGANASERQFTIQFGRSS